MGYVWKVYAKRRLPELRRRPFSVGTAAARRAVPLSSVCGRADLPGHWTPKMDAEAAERIREEIAAVAERERRGIFW